MSAQASDAAAGSARVTVRLPRTIRAVRAALPNDADRAAFAAEMEDGDVAAVLEKWWGRALVASSPRTVAALEQSRAGSLVTISAEVFYGDRWVL